MKVLVTGANGMLGSMLVKQLSLEPTFTPLAATHAELDITNAPAIETYLDQHQPDVVVNCAAYTNVEKAEDEPEQSNIVNGTAVGILAEIVAQRNIKFIHISTDYVFGQNDPPGYFETDQPNEPLNQYGKSKLLGEQLVQQKNPNAYIARTSWVFGPGRKNYIDTMIMLSETRTELNIVDDEHGVPTYTSDIASQLIHIMQNFDKYTPGIYHIVSEGQCTRYEQSAAIYELAGRQMKLNGMALQDYPRKAKIPNYSILHNTKLPKLPHWRDAIAAYLATKAL